MRPVDLQPQWLLDGKVVTEAEYKAAKPSGQIPEIVTFDAYLSDLRFHVVQGELLLDIPGHPTMAKVAQGALRMLCDLLDAPSVFILSLPPTLAGQNLNWLLARAATIPLKLRAESWGGLTLRPKVFGVRREA